MAARSSKLHSPASCSSSSSPSSPSSSPSSHDIFHFEWAVALIFSFTDLLTVSRLASVSRAFLAASQSDLVWSAFLGRLSRRPLGLQSQSGEPPHGLLPKEIFFRLTRSIPLLGGKQRYWVDRSTGCECYMLSARALHIEWGDDRRYWDWVAHAGAWFPEVAHLLTVCWFQIRGAFRETLRPGYYTLSFRMLVEAAGHHRGYLAPRFAGVQSNRERLRKNGWVTAQVKFSVQTSEGQEVRTTRNFCEEKCFARSEAPLFGAMGRWDAEEWVECDAGEILVQKEGEVEVQFGMEEIEQGWWKSGLFVDGVLLRPSSCILQQKNRQLLE